jgi:hypothetical protein
VNGNKQHQQTMKTTKILIIAAAVGSLVASLQPASAQGTAFTYQGRKGVIKGSVNEVVMFSSSPLDFFYAPHN